MTCLHRLWMKILYALGLRDETRREEKRGQNG